MFTEIIMIRDRDNFWRDVMHRNWDWPQNNTDTQIAMNYIINNYPSGSITVAENDKQILLTTEQQIPCVNCGN